MGQREPRPELVPFARRLGKFRVLTGISQRELAARLGVGVSRLCDVEHGVRPPSVALLGALAETYGVTMDELWRGRSV